MALLFKTKTQCRECTIGQDRLDIIKTWSQATLFCDVQPANARDLALFPEGMFSVGAIKVRSDEKLNVKKEGTESNTATHVLFQGTWYELTAEMPWQQATGPLARLNHYKYLANPRTDAEVGL